MEDTLNGEEYSKKDRVDLLIWNVCTILEMNLWQFVKYEWKIHEPRPFCWEADITVCDTTRFLHYMHIYQRLLSRSQVNVLHWMETALLYF